MKEIGCRAFYFTGAGRRRQKFGEGFDGEVYAHIPITVWAFTAAAAYTIAIRQLDIIAPDFAWAIAPASKPLPT